MQEPADKPQRHWSDHEQVTSDDLWKLLQEIRDEQIRQAQSYVSVSEAFVKDDLSKPDFHGHRKAHLGMLKEAAVVNTYKQDATKKIIGAGVVFILGLLAAGFVEAVRR